MGTPVLAKISVTVCSAMLIVLVNRVKWYFWFLSKWEKKAIQFPAAFMYGGKTQRTIVIHIQFWQNQRKSFDSISSYWNIVQEALTGVPTKLSTRWPLTGNYGELYNACWILPRLLSEPRRTTSYYAETPNQHLETIAAWNLRQNKRCRLKIRMFFFGENGLPCFRKIWPPYSSNEVSFEGLITASKLACHKESYNL